CRLHDEISTLAFSRAWLRNTRLHLHPKNNAPVKTVCMLKEEQIGDYFYCFITKLSRINSKVRRLRNRGQGIPLTFVRLKFERDYLYNNSAPTVVLHLHINRNSAEIV